MEAPNQPTAALVHSLCSAITTCKDLDRILNLLQLAVDSLLDFDLEKLHEFITSNQSEIAENLSRLIAIEDESPAETIRNSFYASSFQEFAETLLTFVAPDWLPRFPDQATQQKLFYSFFNEAPSVPLLRCLSWHLSSVQPLNASTRTLVLPVSADIAAELLVDRFTTNNGAEITEILYQALTKPSVADELAGLLAGLPERAALLPNCAPLQPDSFVPLLVSNLVDYAEAQKDAHSICADVLSRLIQRGHTSLVASSIISSIKTATIAQLLAVFPASPAIEKLLEAVVRQIPEVYKDFPPSAAQEKLQSLLPLDVVWSARGDVRFCLQDKLLLQRVLPSISLSLLLEYLNFASTSSTATLQKDADVLAAATRRLASVWSDKSSIQTLPIPQQAYMTAALCASLDLLGKTRFESYPGLLPMILPGISTRLDSPRNVVRLQAMRLGNAMSKVLDSGEALFGDEDLSLMPEEQWEVVEKEVIKGTMMNGRSGKNDEERLERKGKKQEHGGDDYPLTETDSDDDYSSISSSDSEFEQYDLEESDDEDIARTNIQLRDLISMLQKSDTDWKEHLKALRSAESLIRSAPDELTHYAVPLARALLFTKVPNWADEEKRPEDDLFEEQRFRSLVAITAAAPEPVGLQIAAEVYSPSMDLQQRARALAVLACAAQELASPGAYLKPLPEGEGNRNALESNSTKKAGKVIRRSEKSLAAQQQGQHSMNRFPPIALKWAAALLKDCDVRRQGVDLFGRDHFILGRLLATLGSFMEASQHSMEAAPLATAVLELVRGHQVHDSPEPFVRRSALLAASHALMAIPPAAIASAMLPMPGRDSSSPLVERLEWLRDWVVQAEKNDPDANCRMMAAACKGLQGALSGEALAALAASTNQDDSFQLPFGPGSGQKQPQINISIPRLDNLFLK